MGFMGMEVDGARAFAERARARSEHLQGEFDSLDALVRASQEFWRGPDGDAFRSSWAGAYASAAQPAVDLLRTASEQVEADCEQQDEASAADSAGSAGDAPSDGAHGRARPPWAEGDGGSHVDPEVAKAWESMSDQDREKVARVMIEELMREYGIDPSEAHIYFRDIPWLGYWSEDGKELVIDPDHLRSAGALDTIAHEVRHAAQNKFVQDTEPTGWWFWRDDKSQEYEDIQRDHNISRTDIDLWRKNNEPGNYISPPDPPAPDAGKAEWERYYREFAYYEGQPVEVDARDAAKRYAEDLDVSDLDEYKRKAGVS